MATSKSPNIVVDGIRFHYIPIPTTLYCEGPAGGDATANAPTASEELADGIGDGAAAAAEERGRPINCMPQLQAKSWVIFFMSSRVPLTFDPCKDCYFRRDRYRLDNA